MGQLATKISEREPKNFLNQPIPNPKDHYEVSQPSTSGMPREHVQAVTALTYKRLSVEKLNPERVESEREEDVVTLNNQDSLAKDRVITQGPSESKSRNL